MKRHNIYLYEYKNEIKGKNVGFCRLDINDSSVKILISIKQQELGISLDENVEIKADLLTDGGEKKGFKCNKEFISSGNYSNIIDMKDANKVIGLALQFCNKNNLKSKVAGLLDNKNFVEKEIVVQETRKEEEVNPRIKQVELEDTVYNIDMECVKNKEQRAKKLVKLKVEDITTLPTECWKLLKNKFLICSCNRYGHFAYEEKDDKHIIYVPGVVNDKSVGCAKKYGFNTYVQAKACDEENEKSGYWLMKINRKL